MQQVSREGVGRAQSRYASSQRATPVGDNSLQSSRSTLGAHRGGPDRGVTNTDGGAQGHHGMGWARASLAVAIEPMQRSNKNSENNPMQSRLIPPTCTDFLIMKTEIVVEGHAFDIAWARYYAPGRSEVVSEDVARISLAKHLVGMARAGAQKEDILAEAGFQHLVALTSASQGPETSPAQDQDFDLLLQPEAAANSPVMTLPSDFIQS